MMSRLKRALLVVSLLLPALSSRAARVTWQFEGTVTTIGAAEAGALGSLGVFVGTPFVGRLVYDTSAVANSFGLYQGLPELSFTAGAYSATQTMFTASTGFVAIPGANELGVNFSPHQPYSLAYPDLWLELFDTDPANGASLPVEPPLGSATRVLFRLYAGHATPAITSTNFTITRTVPEAARPVLFGVACAGLALFRARRRGSRPLVRVPAP